MPQIDKIYNQIPNGYNGTRAWSTTVYPNPAGSATGSSRSTITESIEIPSNATATRVWWTATPSYSVSGGSGQVQGSSGADSANVLTSPGTTEREIDVEVFTGTSATCSLMLGVWVKNPNASVSGSPRITGTATWSNITLHVQYKLNTTVPSAPTEVFIGPASVAPSGSATLGWRNAAPGTANAITGYQVYRATEANGTYQKISEVNTTATSGSATVTARDVNNTSYYYKVVTKGAASNSGLSEAVQLYSTYTHPAFNSFTINNQKGTVWVGEKGVPVERTAEWTASAGTNNPIYSYILYKDGKQLYNQVTSNSTASTKINISGGQVYQLRVFGTVANSSATSDKITISTLSIGNFAAPSVIPKPGNVGTRDFEFKWTQPSITGTTSKVVYNIYYIDENNKSHTLQSEVSGTSASIKLPDAIQPGQTFKFQIDIIGYARDGGYTLKSVQTGNYKLAGMPNAPVITDIYDKNGPIQQGKQSLGYRNIIIKANAASQANNSGSNFTYRLYYMINEGTYQSTSLQSTEISSKEVNLESLGVAAGSKVTFYINAVDEYGTSVKSATVSLRRFQLPIMTWGSINSGANSGIQITNTISGSFNGRMPTYIGSATVKYRVTVALNSRESGVYSSGEYNQNNQLKSYSLSITCPASQTGADIFWNELYKQVIINQNPKPLGTIIVRLWYDGYDEYATSYLRDFNFNFLRPLGKISEESYSINYLPDRDKYFNPYEKYSITLNPVTWTDASGGIIGGTISRRVTKNGQPVSFSGDTITDIYGQDTTDDLNVTYTLTHIITYSGNSGISSSESTTIKVPIARWCEENNSLRDVSLDRTDSSQCKLSGKLELPEKLCSSTQYANLKKVQYSVYDITTTSATKLLFGPIDITTEQLTNNRIIVFSDKNIGNNTDVIVQAVVSYTNTSDNTLNISTNTVVLHDTAITLALRKGYVGVNVAKDYGEGKSHSATFKINQDQNSGSVMELSTKSAADDYVTFDDGRNIIGKIATNNGNKIFFEGLTYQTNNEISTTESWKDNIYTISCPYVTSQTSQEIYPSPDITLNQLKALQKAQFISNTQTNGSFTIKAMGVKPTVNIPIVLIVRGF